MEEKLAYKNPVYPYYFADPFVWKHEGRYYAVGTGPIAERVVAEEADFSSREVNGEHFAFPLLTSPDLVNWKLHGGALKVHPTFRGGVFWAPEVAYNAEHRRFYMYYSVAMSGLEHRLRSASSESPTGPYIDEGPLLPESDRCPFSIDAHPFRDGDGTWHLFYARDFLDFDANTRAGTALVVDRLIDMTRLAGERRVVLRATCDWQRFQANRPMYGGVYDWHTLEGPCVRFRNGKYYCFYSGGCYQGESYGVDYGVAEKVEGPYSDKGTENGARVLKTAPGRVLGPGHHSIVEGPAGKGEFIVYHAWDPAMKARTMRIDPLIWEGDSPRCLGPT